MGIKREAVCQSAKPQCPPTNIWSALILGDKKTNIYRNDLTCAQSLKWERQHRKLGQCAFLYTAQLPELLTFPAGPSPHRKRKERFRSHRPLRSGLCKADLANRSLHPGLTGQATTPLWEAWLPVSAMVSSQSPSAIFNSLLHPNLYWVYEVQWSLRFLPIHLQPSWVGEFISAWIQDNSSYHFLSVSYRYFPHIISFSSHYGPLRIEVLLLFSSSGLRKLRPLQVR